MFIYLALKCRRIDFHDDIPFSHFALELHVTSSRIVELFSPFCVNDNPFIFLIFHLGPNLYEVKQQQAEEIITVVRYRVLV